MNGKTRPLHPFELRIEAYPRLHLGLISMHADAPRMNGGIGFAIDGPPVEVQARRSKAFSLVDSRQRPMPGGELARMTERLRDFRRTLPSEHEVEVVISGGILSHVGLGSATAIALATTEATAILCGMNLPRNELVAASGRGGTSGIGINTYFGGGLVCDLGQPNNGQQFTPSSRASPVRPALALPAIQMPPWPILLCVPDDVPSKTQVEEAQFFERTTPLRDAESFEAAYNALFGLYAAAAETDREAFVSAVRAMQATAWKRAETRQYGGTLAEIIKKLRDAGAEAVGMSSMGPMLFCFAAEDHLDAVTDAARAAGCLARMVLPANGGRVVTTVHA